MDNSTSPLWNTGKHNPVPTQQTFMNTTQQ